jgi:hypothetical protein
MHDTYKGVKDVISSARPVMENEYVAKLMDAHLEHLDDTLADIRDLFSRLYPDHPAPEEDDAEDDYEEENLDDAEDLDDEDLEDDGGDYEERYSSADEDHPLGQSSMMIDEALARTLHRKMQQLNAAIDDLEALADDDDRLSQPGRLGY